MEKEERRDRNTPNSDRIRDKQNKEIEIEIPNNKHRETGETLTKSTKIYTPRGILQADSEAIQRLMKAYSPRDSIHKPPRSRLLENIQYNSEILNKRSGASDLRDSLTLTHRIKREIYEEDSYTREFQRTRQQVARLSTESAHQKTVIASMTEELENNKEFQKLYLEADSDNKSLRNYDNYLKKQIQDLELKLQNSKKHKETKFGKIQVEFQKVERQLASESHKFESQLHEGELKREELQKETEIQNEMIKELHDEKAQNEQFLQEQIESQKRSKKELYDTIQAMKYNGTNLEEQLIRIRKENEHYMNANHELNTDNEIMKTKLQNLEEFKAQSIKREQEMEEEMSDMMEKTNKIEDRFTGIEENYNALKTQYSIQQEHLDKYEKLVEHQKESILALRENSKEDRTLIADIEERNVRMEDGNNKLESELSRSLQELAIEKERNRELEQLVYNMNLNRQELESEIISMRSAEEHLQKDLNEIAILREGMSEARMSQIKMLNQALNATQESNIPIPEL